MATLSSRDFGRAKATQKENQSRQLKGLSNANTKTRAQKRTVLGSITNVRVQPSRAAKTDHQAIKVDGGQDENAGIPFKVFGKSKNQPFSIYVDQDPPTRVQPPVVSVLEDDIENFPPTLDDAVARLPSIPQSTALQETKGSYFLDMSGVEEEEAEDKHDSESCPSAMAGVEEQERDTIIEDVPEYAEDIYNYLLTVEHKNRPRPGFMRRQEDVTLPMRSILVDWLVEVAEEYKLQRETLFLAVNYIDRFLAQMSVLRSKLQLVGAAAMFLAAKYEEIYPPDVNEFVYITDDTYQKKQILRMEHMILKVLKFDIATPTINWFCERLLRSVQAESRLKHLAMYICELVLVDFDKYLVFPSSMVAASAVCLANYTVGAVDFWPPQCETMSHYTAAQLLPCVQMMYDMHSNAENHPQQAIREKYRLAKYDGVAEVCPQPMLCLV